MFLLYINDITRSIGSPLYNCFLMIVCYMEQLIPRMTLPSFNKILTDYQNGHKYGNLDLMYQNVL